MEVTLEGLHGIEADATNLAGTIVPVRELGAVQSFRCLYTLAYHS